MGKLGEGGPAERRRKSTGRTRHSRWLPGCPLNGSDRVIPKRFPCRELPSPPPSRVCTDRWGGFSPGSEGLSLAGCGLRRPCGTRRRPAALLAGSSPASTTCEPAGPEPCPGGRDRGTRGSPSRAWVLLGQESRERNPSAAGMLSRQQLLLGFRCPLSSCWSRAPAPPPRVHWPPKGQPGTRPA